MHVRPNHEDPDPRPTFVSLRPEGVASSAFPHAEPAAGKEKGRAMVFRGKRSRSVLLWAGDDHASSARRAFESCNFLPWRSNHGAIERLNKVFLKGTISLFIHELHQCPQVTTIHSRKTVQVRLLRMFPPCHTKSANGDPRKASRTTELSHTLSAESPTTCNCLCLLDTSGARRPTRFTAG
jgi:hypothetical protein